MVEPQKAFATTPSKIDPATLINNKYGWYLSFTDTTVENNGCAHPFTLQKEIYTRDNYKAYNVLGHRYYSAGELNNLNGAAIRWTGGKYIDGTPIDLVMTITSCSPGWRASDGPGQEYCFFYCTTVGELSPYHQELRKDINLDAPLFEFCGFDLIDLNFKFYKAGTNIPIRLSGHTTLSDVDWGEKLSFVDTDYVFLHNKNSFLTVTNETIQAPFDTRNELEQISVTACYDSTGFNLKYYGNPYKVGLACFDSSTIANFLPEDPSKSYFITD